MTCAIYSPGLENIVIIVHQFLPDFDKKNLNEILNSSSHNFKLAENNRDLCDKTVHYFYKIKFINAINQCCVCSINKKLEPNIKLMFGKLKNSQDVICNYCLLDEIMEINSNSGYSSDGDSSDGDSSCDEDV
jgi:hypothetical protein